MANRAYIYSISNQPSSYADRPETISGLSEWAYMIPLSYRVLMSGNPRLCASLISDGFDGELPEQKTRLYAIVGDFDAGYARLKKLLSLVRIVGSASPALGECIDETLEFLESHQDRYVLLETIELDSMTADGEAELLASVQNEIRECIKVAEAIDALPADATEAASTLIRASTEDPLSAFYGLRFDDNFDNVRDGNEHPLGLEWSDVLFFGLWNRAEFEANS
ncbi:MAG: hypothetical protein ACRC8S_04340 [Fimbriiglobus sp.]